MLTRVLFAHNERISAEKDKRRALPISAYKGEANDPVESFGLASANRGELPNTPAELFPSSHTPKVKMKTLNYCQLQDALSTVNIGEVQDALVSEFSSEDALFLLNQAVSSFYISISCRKCHPQLTSTIAISSLPHS